MNRVIIKLIHSTTIKLMKYQLKKAENKYKKQKHSVIKSARAVVVKNYKNTIMFLEADSKNI